MGSFINFIRQKIITTMIQDLTALENFNILSKLLSCGKGSMTIFSERALLAIAEAWVFRKGLSYY